MARHKVGSRGERTTVAQQLSVMRRQLKLAVAAAKQDKCAQARKYLDKAYDRAQYPAVHRTRALATEAFQRTNRAVHRICRW